MNIQKYLKYLLPLLFLAVFYSCNHQKTIVDYQVVTIDSTLQESNEFKNSLKPYRDELNKTMNTVLARSDQEFVKKQPESNLSNLVADLTLETAVKKDFKADMCLLNFGGLRTSLPKGNITVGKIYELMPFENEIVTVTISAQQFDSLIHYIIKVGGQPVSGIKIIINKDKTFKLYDVSGNVWPQKKEYTIVTTDYLAQGGDHMDFFLNPVKYQEVGIKLRDAILNYVKEKGDNNELLKGTVDGRIKFL
jgi:2',3'-cyclic-nucleotide 2'-phosphodiesterase (5'-nucleotidase family)